MVFYGRQIIKMPQKTGSLEGAKKSPSKSLKGAAQKYFDGSFGVKLLCPLQVCPV